MSNSSDESTKDSKIKKHKAVKQNSKLRKELKDAQDRKAIRL